MKAKLSFALALYLIATATLPVQSIAVEADSSENSENGYVIYDYATKTETYLPSGSYSSQAHTASSDDYVQIAPGYIPEGMDVAFDSDAASPNYTFDETDLHLASTT